jgi:hypothetical protein
MVGDLLRSVAEVGFVKAGRIVASTFAKATVGKPRRPPDASPSPAATFAPTQEEVATLRRSDAGIRIRAFRRRCEATIRPAKWRMPPRRRA